MHICARGYHHATSSQTLIVSLTPERHGLCVTQQPLNRFHNATPLCTYAHILPPRTVLGLITLSCLGSGSTVQYVLIFAVEETRMLPFHRVCVAVYVCVCVCSTGLAKRGTSVHILDIHFYCNRKHLGQMLACSEVTCGFETGHSFPISAWEPKERETIK